MTKFFLTISLATFILSHLFGQEYLGYERVDIKKKFQEFVDTSYKISITDTITHIDSFHSPKGDIIYFDTISNIKALIEGFEKIELEYFFGDGSNLCDSITMKFYYCGKCADRHIKEFLNDKYRKWKQIGTDIYISRKQTNTYMTIDKSTAKKIMIVGSPQMVIKRTPDEPVCVTVYFSTPMMSKDKWKQLTKK